MPTGELQRSMCPSFSGCCICRHPWPTLPPQKVRSGSCVLPRTAKRRGEKWGFRGQGEATRATINIKHSKPTSKLHMRFYIGIIQRALLKYDYASMSFGSTRILRVAHLLTDGSLETTSGPNVRPQLVGLLFYGHPHKGPPNF